MLQEIKIKVKELDGLFNGGSMCEFSEKFNEFKTFLESSEDESKSSGIVSYLASPHQIREQYEKEYGININTLPYEVNQLEYNKVLRYADWLEQQLISLAAR